MIPIQTITGPAAALPHANVDTDQIIPARFMSRSRTEGYGDQCFHDLRFAADGSPRADFALGNLPGPPTVLVADENFGCGSSREAAVYALMDFGVRVVLAPSFGDIFRSNAGKNGLLTIALPKARILELTGLLQSDPGMQITVDLPTQRVRCAGFDAGFEIDARLKDRLERGLDELSATMEHEGQIAAFEVRHLGAGTWRIPEKS